MCKKDIGSHIMCYGVSFADVFRICMDPYHFGKPDPDRIGVKPFTIKVTKLIRIWIRISIKDKIQKLWRLKMEPRWAMGAHIVCVEAKNGAVVGLYASDRSFASLWWEPGSGFESGSKWKVGSGSTSSWWRSASLYGGLVWIPSFKENLSCWIVLSQHMHCHLVILAKHEHCQLYKCFWKRSNSMIDSSFLVPCKRHLVMGARTRDLSNSSATLGCNKTWNKPVNHWYSAECGGVQMANQNPR